MAEAKLTRAQNRSRIARALMKLAILSLARKEAEHGQ